MEHVFSPITFRGKQLKNRLVVSPMCQYSSEDGFANDWHLVHLGSRAVGGAGLVFSEATAVSPEGRITPADLGIWKDEHISGLKRITDFIHAQKSLAGIQLAHAGRKASVQVSWLGGENLTAENGGWQTVGPSAIPFNEKSLCPAELTIDEIQQIISDFTAAAKRSVAAGFDIIELHAAHGYLINEFLSPLSNQRTDKYGGTFEDRCRFLEEIVVAVRKSIPEETPLFVRISATEWIEGGWSENDSVELSMRLKELGVDLIDCSTGGNVSGVRIPIFPLYQTPLAEKVRNDAKIPTGAVGLITTAEEANSIIQNRRADLVFMAREFLRNPYFPLQAAHLLEFDIEWPVQYERGKFRRKDS